MKMKRIYPECVPLRTEKIEWTADNDGLVTITTENKGFFNRAFQLILKKPRFSHIRLDEKGSFFWKNADGTHTLEEIAESLADFFGESKSFEAAAKFLEILCSCGFAEIVNNI